MRFEIEEDNVTRKGDIVHPSDVLAATLTPSPLTSLKALRQARVDAQLPDKLRKVGCGCESVSRLHIVYKDRCHFSAPSIHVLVLCKDCYHTYVKYIVPFVLCLVHGSLISSVFDYHDCLRLDVSPSHVAYIAYRRVTAVALAIFVAGRV